MLPFLECSPQQGGRAVLLSVKPKYADLIVSGEKRVEFRRIWASDTVGMIAIYSSSPVQRIVGLVEVEGMVSLPPAKLWSVCKSRGGGLTRKELLGYFEGKREGFGVLLGAVHVPLKPLDPSLIVKDFRAPQSFRYLTVSEFKRIEKKIGIGVGA